MPLLADRVLSCVAGLFGSIAVVLIIGLVALARFGSVRLALAAVMRTVGSPTLRLYRWLSKEGDRR
jgi:hypothetical protein